MLDAHIKPSLSKPVFPLLCFATEPLENKRAVILFHKLRRRTGPKREVRRCVTQRAHLFRNRYEVVASGRRGGDSVERNNMGQHWAKHDGGVNQYTRTRKCANTRPGRRPFNRKLLSSCA